MKKQIKLFGILTIAFALFLITCKEDKDDFTTEEAKVELRSASQEVQTSMDEIMTASAIQTLEYLMALMDGEGDLKSLLKSASGQIDKLNIIEVNKFLRESVYLKLDDLNPEDGGRFEYNFETNVFDKTQELDYLMILFPSDDIAYSNQQNNAELTLLDLEYVEIEYIDEEGNPEWEVVLTNVVATLQVDGETLMNLSYSLQLNDEELPVSMTINLNMPPYTMNLNLSGTGLNYASTMTLKENNDVLLSYDLTIKYTADLDDVDEVSGNIEIPPLRFEGKVYPYALDNCDENDIDCLNNNFLVELIHTEQNKIIGDLEFRLYYDEEWDEEYPQPVVVYADGTWEYLHIVLGMELKGFKLSLLR